MNTTLEETYELMAREAISRYGVQRAVIGLLKERDRLRGQRIGLIAACESFLSVFRESDMSPEDACHEISHEMCKALARCQAEDAEHAWEQFRDVKPGPNSPAAKVFAEGDRCADCGGRLPSVFNYCPNGSGGSECRSSATAPISEAHPNA